ncbi:MAG TPA: hypothetical protein PK677_17575 [Acidiphilium sp.]|nr:hypothetical protein [Acidiphilium sp.]
MFDDLCFRALAAPTAMNLLPSETLCGPADRCGPDIAFPCNGTDHTDVIGTHRRAGIDVCRLADGMQFEGTDEFVKGLQKLLTSIGNKSGELHA